MNETVEILLAVHNAEPYLEQQLASLSDQTYRNWRLVISDDASTDGTGAIIREYHERFPDKICLLSPQAASVGAARNFARLMEHATTRYCMFCDHDDVWLPRKIEISLHKMLKLESTCGKEVPLLVHTDLKVVDRDLKVVADSLWSYQKSDPEEGAKLCRLLLQNVATGCTVMINKALRDRALSIPQGAIMHDWWLALTAAAFGRIGIIAEPTVLYRQHGRNDTGARSWSAGHILRQLTDLQATRDAMRRTQAQARAFLQSNASALQSHDLEMVTAYACLSEQGFWLRRYYLFRYGFAYTGLLRNLGLFLFA